MVVGQPFAGKSACRKALGAALTLLATEEAAAEGGGEGGGGGFGARVVEYVCNPKAITMGQLYGQNDPASHEWTDGVLAVLFRRWACVWAGVRRVLGCRGLMVMGGWTAGVLAVLFRRWGCEDGPGGTCEGGRGGWQCCSGGGRVLVCCVWGGGAAWGLGLGTCGRGCTTGGWSAVHECGEG